MEYLKLMIGLIALLAGGPVVAMVVGNSPRMKRVALALLLFLTALHPRWIHLTVFSEDWYRGHVRGFEIGFVDILAIGLVLGALIRKQPKGLGERKRPLVWMPLGAWLVYCLIGALSISDSISPWFGLMAVWKYSKLALVLVGTWLSVEDEDDLRVLMWAGCAALLIEGVVGLRDRYAWGVWRVKSWFEHSNALAIWCYLMALPLLGLALRKETPLALSLVSFAAYLSAAALVVMTLARASLAALAVGTVMTFVLCLITRPSARAAGIGVVMLFVGSLMGLVAMDSIIGRMKAEENAGVDVEDARAVFNLQAAAMLRRDPLLGVGWNNYGLANSRPHGAAISAIIEEWTANRGQNVNNLAFTSNALTESLYWLHLGELGWLGFIAYVAFLIALLIPVALAAKRHRRTSVGGYAIGLLVALIIAYGHGSVERVLVQTKNLTALLILAGAVGASATWRPRVITASHKSKLVDAVPVGSAPLRVPFG